MTNPMEATIKVQTDLERQLRNHEIDREVNLENIQLEERNRERFKQNRLALISRGHSDQTIKQMTERSESKARTYADNIKRCDLFISTAKAELEILNRNIEKMKKAGLKEGPEPKPSSNLSLREMREWQEQHEARPTNRQSSTNNVRPKAGIAK